MDHYDELGYPIVEGFFIAKGARSGNTGELAFYKVLDSDKFKVQRVDPDGWRKYKASTLASWDDTVVLPEDRADTLQEILDNAL